MPHEDQAFLVQRNIARFSRLLESEGDEKKRSTLKNLLREERCKQHNGSAEGDEYLRH